MKYVKQFTIIILVSFIGEILKDVIPLPVPASIYGMAIMFAGLLTGIIKLDSVKETGDFLVEIMPIMFIAPGVGLMDSWGIIKPIIVSLSIIIIVTNTIVMAPTGLAATWIIKRTNSKHGE